MTLDERKILRLEAKVDELKYQIEDLQIKNGTLKAENKALIKSLRADDNGEYIYYLQTSLKRMEDLHVDQQRTIEAYIKHFNKFRHYLAPQEESDHDIMEV